MRRGWKVIGLSTLLVAVAVPTTSQAFVRPDQQPGDGRREALDGRRLRRGASIVHGHVPASAQRAWTVLEAELGPTWAAWDAATETPRRILAGSIVVSGAVADPEIARRHAEAFVRRHLALLAPGTSFDDFEVITNHQSAGIRSIGFAQRLGDTRVLGGQISLRYKGDRLSLIASDAVPLRGVGLPPVTPQLDATLYEAQAIAALADLPGTPVHAHRDADAVVLPVIDEAGVTALRRVIAVDVRFDAPTSRYTVYVDQRDASPVAREPTLHFADATVRLSVPVRGPYAERVERPAPYLEALVDGDPVVGDGQGVIEVPDGPATLDLFATGQLVAVDNQAGDPATLRQAVDGAGPSAPLLWDAAEDELVDAELTTYLYANEVKDYVREIGSANEVQWIDEQLPANVNIDDSCNAFWDGREGTINFFIANEDCENTGRLTDVVNHEFGHGIHSRALIEGVGTMDIALSEGISDYLAATIVEDPAMGRGFFFDERPIRELDPPDYEWHWPEDRGEVHAEGRIIGGTLWDLRTAFSEQLGPEAGVAYTDLIWFEATRRASDIPTMFYETLLIDDDDGDLQNGTPNDCLIADTFGAHGLYQAAVTFDPPTVLPVRDDGHRLVVEIEQPFDGCGVQTDALVEWRLRRQPDFGGQTPLVPDGQQIVAALPSVPAGTVIQYRIVVDHSNSSTQLLPSNVNDPWYETFVGDVEPIYCTDFERDPEDEGWTHGGDENADEWAWGPPGGKSGDPDAAVSGTKVFGLDLGGDEGDGNGRYHSNGHSWARSPMVDVSDYEIVRLQYRRWLEVEDGFFDQANLLANGESAWTHFASEDENDASRHHRDGEWRFHDVDISEYVTAGEVQLEFDLRSDAGLHMGGWTLDDMCVVGYVAVNTCGDAVLELGEDCDDGNTKNGDGCSKTCAFEGLEDDGGTGGAMGSNGEDEGCACVVDDTDRRGRTGLGALALLVLVAWRRRARAA